MEERKPDGYWTRKNTLEEARVVVEELGYLPCGKELYGLGKSSLVYSIQKHFGFIEIRKKLKIPQRKKENGYWMNFDNVKKALNQIKRKIGHFPRHYKEIEEYGGSGLSSAIREYHGNIRSVATRMGSYTGKKFSNLDELLKELKKIKRENGFSRIPSQVALEKLGNYSLPYWIKYHGGIDKIRAIVGENPRVKRGNWKDSDYILQKAKEFKKKHKLKRLPNSHAIEKMGYSSLAAAIRRIGYANIRKHLGEKSNQVSHGSWKSLEYVIERAKKILEENSLEELPSTTRLDRLGYRSLNHAISRYHGGYKAFKKTFYEHIGRPSENKQLESMLEQYAGVQNE